MELSIYLPVYIIHVYWINRISMCSKYSCYNLYLFPGDGDNSVSRNSNLKYIFFSSRSRRSFIIPKNTFILISKAFCCWLNKSKLTNFKCIVRIWVTREIFRNECSEMKHMEMMPVCEQKKKYLQIYLLQVYLPWFHIRK